MPGLVDALYHGFQNSRFKPVVPPIPHHDVAEVPGLAFGLPWPWQQADECTAPRDTEPIVEVMAPRTDGFVAFTVWRDHEPASIEPIIASAGTRLADLYRGRLLQTRRILLDRARTVLVSVAEPHGDIIWRLVGEWDTKLFHGEIRLPSADAAGYQPHIDTMLGTWRWGG